MNKRIIINTTSFTIIITKTSSFRLHALSFTISLHRMTTPDCAFYVPYNRNHNIFQPFYCASITQLDITLDATNPVIFPSAKFLT